VSLPWNCGILSSHPRREVLNTALRGTVGPYRSIEARVRVSGGKVIPILGNFFPMPHLIPCQAEKWRGQSAPENRER
jgi:hypothetical protein